MIKESTSRLAMCKLESYWQISSAKWNESMAVYSLANESVKNFSKNFVGRCINSWKNRARRWYSIAVSLWILPNPYKVPGLEPTGFILL